MEGGSPDRRPFNLSIRVSECGKKVDLDESILSAHTALNITKQASAFSLKDII